MNSALNCTRKPISHESRSDECDIGFQVQFNAEFTSQVMNFPWIAWLNKMRKKKTAVWFYPAIDEIDDVDAKQYHRASFSTRNSALNTSLRKPIRMQDFIQLCDSICNPSEYHWHFSSGIQKLVNSKESYHVNVDLFPAVACPSHYKEQPEICLHSNQIKSL